VLEFAAKGSLADLLAVHSQGHGGGDGGSSGGSSGGSGGSSVVSGKEPLAWDEPLLRLATDVARGMAYVRKHETSHKITL